MIEITSETENYIQVEITPSGRDMEQASNYMMFGLCFLGIVALIILTGGIVFDRNIPSESDLIVGGIFLGISFWGMSSLVKMWRAINAGGLGKGILEIDLTRKELIYRKNFKLMFPKKWEEPFRTLKVVFKEYAWEYEHLVPLNKQGPEWSCGLMVDNKHHLSFQLELCYDDILKLKELNQVLSHHLNEES